MTLDKLTRREFLKKTGKIGLDTALIIYGVGCGKKNNVTPNGPDHGTATLYIYDFHQNPVTGGSVDTDKGRYGIANGVSNIEYNISNRCEIDVPGFVKWEAYIKDGRDYILVPSEWEQFFAHNNIGRRGTHKFTSPILTYIDGPTDDPDYETVKQRLAISGSGRANNLVNDINSANFVIHLNTNYNDHGEHVSGGVINDCDIRLKDGQKPQFYPLWIAADEEIAEGLTHSDDVSFSIIPAEGQDSCIAGAHKGWQNIDKLIMDAIYSRKYSVFYGNGTEREL